MAVKRFTLTKGGVMVQRLHSPESDELILEWENYRVCLDLPDARKLIRRLNRSHMVRNFPLFQHQKDMQAALIKACCWKP